MADAANCPNHLEGHTVDKKPAADYRPTGKQNSYEFTPNHADVVALLFVNPILPTTLVDRLAPDVTELRLGTIDIAVAAAKLAHQAKVAAVDYRGGIPAEGELRMSR